MVWVETMSEFRDSQEIIECQKECYVSRRVHEIHDSKIGISHHIADEVRCPLNREVVEGCFDCDYTDILSRCCYPVNIMEAIHDGKARPWEEGDDE